MPIHDWKKGFNGIFHDFHQTWAGRIKETLNRELPRGYYALLEQNATGVASKSIEADILALKKIAAESHSNENAMGVPGGAAVIATRPKATIEASLDLSLYMRKQNRVVVRHRSGNRIVAIVEIVSPGKSRRKHLESFVEKAVGLLENGIHLAVVDLFPPSKFDPRGIHSAIWDAFGATEEQAFDPLHPLTVVGYKADIVERVDAYVESLAFGDPIPAVPLFLLSGEHILVPFEETYESAWAALPIDCREMVESGKE